MFAPYCKAALLQHLWLQERSPLMTARGVGFSKAFSVSLPAPIFVALFAGAEVLEHPEEYCPVKNMNGTRILTFASRKMI